MHKSSWGLWSRSHYSRQPIAVFAQTTTSDNSSIIAALEQLIVILTKELQQLLAARAGSIQNSPALLTATPTSGTAPLTVTFTNSTPASNNLRN